MRGVKEPQLRLCRWLVLMLFIKRTPSLGRSVKLPRRGRQKHFGGGRLPESLRAENEAPMGAEAEKSQGGMRRASSFPPISDWSVSITLQRGCVLSTLASAGSALRG